MIFIPLFFALFLFILFTNRLNKKNKILILLVFFLILIILLMATLYFNFDNALEDRVIQNQK
ncbi:hypothetical protein B0A78_07970 [Flavobacterium columnare NBRC 100251 = ATCC 23463]|nr:hypothetical protein [Flavobacterium columnare]MBF6656236.1 hypothetical protein [Flavobacterium columnare]MBF6658893.1 hypothetical protein [Flavobacterium columnare]OOB82869.1 hypothetical protein BZL53_07900 [Flavobacterium columnare]PDS23990.1 hypothetical protein B0A78_07970 [Flavobacterium columnare NBRC 100251 = ATCC 23463]